MAKCWCASGFKWLPSVRFGSSRSSGGKNDGWNDPPLFTYNPSAQTVPSRNRLNKRVGFPLSSPARGAAQDSTDPKASGMLLNPKDGPPKLPPVQILPPTMSTVVHPPVPVVLPTLSPPVDPTGLPPSFASAARDPHRSETLPELLERLDLNSADSLRKYTKKILHEMVDECQDSIQGRSREDVQARLGLLDDQWRDQKLSEDAKVKLGCLACALKNEDVKHADSLHLALMVDHISEVSQWMVGVKRLINELKLKLSDNKLPPPSPKKLFCPSATPSLPDSQSLDAAHPSSASSPPSSSPLPTTQSLEGSSVDERNSKDLCMNTDKFSDLKPVLMPEVFISSGAGADTKDSDGLLEKQEQKLHNKSGELQGGDAGFQS
ncbi:steroid receptor RNA activator 1-like [Elysia marginata]|uniref:Steroid receptor RNA activator 1-like n=1 Tax=Elysia marginata TaxID=1093978 RepID=A0AAV4IDP3_9GAST|nr:steroid receptor RNA activator 1-like [Elysia marginata]